MPTFNFTTGQTLLPDVGALSYNRCDFGPLFETKVSGNPVKDNARRTVKYVEYTIVADGYVTLPAGANDITGTMATLYRLLTAQGGRLVYKGKALDIVAAPGGTESGGDVAWGPIPEMLEFQPLGGGRSAKISWKVTVRLVTPAISGISARKSNAGLASTGLLQLNYETSVSYDDAGFSSLSIKGTMECPMTRRFQNDRIVQDSIDRFRSELDKKILSGIDLGRFHVVKRDFNISRDKRTMEWDFEAQEKPYMDLPPGCTVAHGSYSVRPTKSGPGLANWLCTLRATYTVAGGLQRYRAWNAFLALMNLRMQQTLIAPNDDGIGREILKALGGVPSKKPWIIDFTIDEGLYLDSRTISFSATWRLIVPFSQIIRASGTWRKVPEGADGKTSARNQSNNLWAISMTSSPAYGNIMGSKSWLTNRLDPSLDIIVDMGSGV